jgi:hypothetical protein
MVKSMGLAPKVREARDADRQRSPARRVGYFQQSNQANDLAQWEITANSSYFNTFSGLGFW